jgi:hypothetical protein
MVVPPPELVVGWVIAVGSVIVVGAVVASIIAVGAIVGALTIAVASVVGSAAVVAWVVGDGCTTAVELVELPPHADSPTTAAIVSMDKTPISFTLRIFFFPPSKSLVPFAPHPLYAFSANLHSYTHSRCRVTTSVTGRVGE